MNLPETIPLFPLHSVLFPGGPLSLRIFETRYIDMVSRCLRGDTGFGVCLIRDGEEVGRAAQGFEVGTYGRITHWDRRPDGLLGITVTGERRFEVVESEVQSDQLVVARIRWLEESPPIAVPARFGTLAELLRRIMAQLGEPYASLDTDYDNAAWVSSRLAELLPIKLVHKQFLLQNADPLQRLERLATILENGGLGEG